MTVFELELDEIRPKKNRQPSGVFFYSCGLCGAPVGIYSPKEFHVREGWLYKRDKCVNDHIVNWEEQ